MFHTITLFTAVVLASSQPVDDGTCEPEPELAHFALTPGGITFRGHTIVSLTDGALPESEHHGQLIPSLYDVALELSDSPQSVDQVLLDVAPDTPLQTTLAAVYTLSQARFGAPSIRVHSLTPG